jgi:hypothetical protein
MGFHPLNVDAARRSHFWNAFPQPLQTEFFEKAPAVDMGIYPLGNVAKVPAVDMGIYPPRNSTKMPTEAVPQPPQDEVFEKNPTQAVKQPQQCDPCFRNPTEAVRQPPQCENVCFRNPTEAVKQPQQCGGPCDPRTPSEAVRQPLDIECWGPTMRFNMKEDTSAEIAIYTVNGRLVRRLSAMLWSGETDVTWDGTDNRGARAASGVYFARVQANQETGKGKLVLVR